MMKFYTRAGELYPHWLLEEKPEFPGDVPIELSAAEFADYERVSTEWEAWQDRIAAANEAARQARRSDGAGGAST